VSHHGGLLLSLLLLLRHLHQSFLGILLLLTLDGCA
jgi:hypothetical protein